MSFTPISSGGVAGPGGRMSHVNRERERVSAPFLLRLVPGGHC